VSGLRNRQAAVPGRLIEDRVARDLARERRHIGVLLHLEGIEAGAQQEHELVAQHVAGGAELATIAVMLAQQPRLAVGAAVPELRKLQRDQGQPVEIRRKLRDPAAVRPRYAGRRLPARDGGSVGEKARRRNDHRHVVRDRRVVGNAHKIVIDHMARLNESHKHAP
jgi:hypothetical protein